MSACQPAEPSVTSPSGSGPERPERRPLCPCAPKVTAPDEAAGVSGGKRGGTAASGLRALPAGAVAATNPAPARPHPVRLYFEKTRWLKHPVLKAWTPCNLLHNGCPPRTASVRSTLAPHGKDRPGWAAPPTPPPPGRQRGNAWLPSLCPSVPRLYSEELPENLHLSDPDPASSSHVCHRQTERQN